MKNLEEQCRADIGAIVAGVNIVVPLPAVALVLPVTLIVLGLLVVGSYRLIANTFKWLTLALFAYVAASFLAKTDWAWERTPRRQWQCGMRRWRPWMTRPSIT